MSEYNRLIIGISGASGAILGIELLKAVKRIPELRSHLILTRSAEMTVANETDITLEQVIALADFTSGIDDMSADIASGTCRTAGMAIVPCSMKTLAGINCGYSENLLLRAADVCIKERRKLVLAPREMPLNPIHLRNMLSLSEMGVTIMPPMLTFYNRPKSISEINAQFVGRILDSFGYDTCNLKRWG